MADEKVTVRFESDIADKGEGTNPILISGPVDIFATTGSFNDLKTDDTRLAVKARIDEYNADGDGDIEIPSIVIYVSDVTDLSNHDNQDSVFHRGGYFRYDGDYEHLASDDKWADYGANAWKEILLGTHSHNNPTVLEKLTQEHIDKLNKLIKEDDETRNSTANLGYLPNLPTDVQEKIDELKKLQDSVNYPKTSEAAHLDATLDELNNPDTHDTAIGSCRDIYLELLKADKKLYIKKEDGKYSLTTDKTSLGWIKANKQAVNFGSEDVEDTVKAVDSSTDGRYKVVSYDMSLDILDTDKLFLYNNGEFVDITSYNYTIKDGKITFNLRKSKFQYADVREFSVVIICDSTLLDEDIVNDVFNDISLSDVEAKLSELYVEGEFFREPDIPHLYLTTGANGKPHWENVLIPAQSFLLDTYEITQSDIDNAKDGIITILRDKLTYDVGDFPLVMVDELIRPTVASQSATGKVFLTLHTDEVSAGSKITTVMMKSSAAEDFSERLKKDYISKEEAIEILSKGKLQLDDYLTKRDAAATYAKKDHIHTEYALVGHDHDFRYANYYHTHPELMAYMVELVKSLSNGDIDSDKLTEDIDAWLKKLSEENKSLITSIFKTLGEIEYDESGNVVSAYATDVKVQLDSSTISALNELCIEDGISGLADEKTTLADALNKIFELFREDTVWDTQVILQDPITVRLSNGPVGGIDTERTYAQNTSLQTILRDILNPYVSVEEVKTRLTPASLKVKWYNLSGTEIVGGKLSHALLYQNLLFKLVGLNKYGDECSLEYVNRDRHCNEVEETIFDLVDDAYKLVDVNGEIFYKFVDTEITGKDLLEGDRTIRLSYHSSLDGNTIYDNYGIEADSLAGEVELPLTGLTKGESKFLIYYGSANDSVLNELLELSKFDISSGLYNGKLPDAEDQKEFSDSASFIEPTAAGKFTISHDVTYALLFKKLDSGFERVAIYDNSVDITDSFTPIKLSHPVLIDGESYVVSYINIVDYTEDKVLEIACESYYVGKYAMIDRGYARIGGFPLDLYSVFANEDSLIAYIKKDPAIAYVGQLVAVKETDGYDVYVIYNVNTACKSLDGYARKLASSAWVETITHDLSTKIETLEASVAEELNNIKKDYADKIDSLNQAVIDETNRAKDVENRLIDDIGTSFEKVDEEIQTLHDNIENEVERATQAEEKILSDAKEYTDTKLKDINNSVTALESQVNINTEDIKTLKEDATRIEKKADDAAAAISSLTDSDPEKLADLKKLIESGIDKLATKDEITEAVKDKANSADVYTKTEVDTKIAEASGSINEIQLNGITQPIVDKTVNLTVTTPGELSEVKSELENKITAIPKFEIKVVSTLPSTGESGVVYLVPDGQSTGSDLYDEYIYINNKFELLGHAAIDMTDYLTKDDYESSVSSKITAALSGYLKSNEISDWAKASTKPSYTAEEVGALSKDTVIPTKVSDLADASEYAKKTDIPTDYAKADEVTAALENYAKKEAVPTKVSELENDTQYATTTELNSAITDFITVNVDNLVNYYTKSEVYTQTEVNDLIAKIPHFSIQVVKDHTAVEDPSYTTIYLETSSNKKTADLYTEYIYVKDEDAGTSDWEILGVSTVQLDDYATNEEVTSAIEKAISSIDYETIVNKILEKKGYATTEYIEANYATKTELEEVKYYEFFVNDVATKNGEVQLTAGNTYALSGHLRGHIIIDATGVLSTGSNTTLVFKNLRIDTDQQSAINYYTASDTAEKGIEIELHGENAICSYSAGDLELGNTGSVITSANNIKIIGDGKLTILNNYGGHAVKADNNLTIDDKPNIIIKNTYDKEYSATLHGHDGLHASDKVVIYNGIFDIDGCNDSIGTGDSGTVTVYTGEFEFGNHAEDCIDAKAGGYIFDLSCNLSEVIANCPNMKFISTANASEYITAEGTVTGATKTTETIGTTEVTVYTVLTYNKKAQPTISGYFVNTIFRVSCKADLVFDNTIIINDSTITEPIFSYTAGEKAFGIKVNEDMQLLAISQGGTPIICEDGGNLEIKGKGGLFTYGLGTCKADKIGIWNDGHRYILSSDQKYSLDGREIHIGNDKDHSETGNAKEVIYATGLYSRVASEGDGFIDFENTQKGNIFITNIATEAGYYNEDYELSILCDKSLLHIDNIRFGTKYAKSLQSRVLILENKIAEKEAETIDWIIGGAA